MALPQIDSDPTAFARVPAALRISRTTSVAEARAHLRLTREPSAVVFADGRPVGVVTDATLADAVNDGDADAPVGMVMDYVAVPVDRAADARTTVATFTAAAWDWLRRRHA